MRLIIIGCEYAGTTTLAIAIRAWAQVNLGLTLPVHDHWKLPHVSGHPPYEVITILSSDEKRQVLGLTPKLKEIFTRYTTYYHTPSSPNEPGSILVGYYIEDLVYAETFFSYGEEAGPGDRRMIAQDIEQRLLENAPDTVLILVKADPKVLVARMRKHRHAYGLISESNIDLVSTKFEQEYLRSHIPYKLALDTTTATEEETLAEFVKKIKLIG